MTLSFFCSCRYIYSVEYGRVVDTKAGHDDASKCLSLNKLQLKYWRLGALKRRAAMSSAARRRLA